MKDIKLSDIKIPSDNKKQDTQLMTSEEIETLNVKNNYSREMQSKKIEITKKIEELENKLKKHSLKEGMLDKIILTTYTELDNLSDKEFTRRGQKQTVLIKQLEALSILHDTMMKYEDMIQKYHKIIMDIENNQLNSYIKIMNLKKEEKDVDEGIGSVLMELQDMMKNGGSTGSNPILDDLAKELSDSDY